MLGAKCFKQIWKVGKVAKVGKLGRDGVCRFHAHSHHRAAVQTVAEKGNSWPCEGEISRHKDEDDGSRLLRFQGDDLQQLCPQSPDCQQGVRHQSAAGVSEKAEEEKARVGE